MRVKAKRWVGRLSAGVSAAVAASALAMAPVADAGWSRPAAIVGKHTGGPMISAARDHATVGWVDGARSIRLRRLDLRGRPTPAVKVSGEIDPQGEVDDPSIAETPDGTVIAVWFKRTGDPRSVIRARRIGPRAGLGRVITVAPWDAVSDPGAMHLVGGSGVDVDVDRRGNAFVAWAEVEGESWHAVLHSGFDVSRTTIHARRLGANGRLGPVLDLAVVDDLLPEPDVSVTAPGRATVVWASRDAGSSAIHAATIRHDGRAGLTRTIARDDATGGGMPRAPEIASNGRAHAVVIWQPRWDGPVLASRLLPGGSSPARAVTHGPPAGPAQAVVDARGRATIAWDRRLEEGVRRHRGMFRRMSGAGRLGRVRRLFRGDIDEARAPADHSLAGLTVARDGTVTAIWTGPVVERPRRPWKWWQEPLTIRARRISPSGRLNRPRMLSRRGWDGVYFVSAAGSEPHMTAVAWSADGALRAARFLPRLGRHRGVQPER